MRKMGDFEAAPQKKLKGGVRWEASRAKLSYLVTWLLGDLSIFWWSGYLARRFVRIFTRKMGDFEAACQEKLTQGKRLEASRATKFLSKSSAHRLAGLAIWCVAWYVGVSVYRYVDD